MNTKSSKASFPMNQDFVDLLRAFAGDPLHRHIAVVKLHGIDEGVIGEDDQVQRRVHDVKCAALVHPRDLLSHLPHEVVGGVGIPARDIPDMQDKSCGAHCASQYH